MKGFGTNKPKINFNSSIIKKKLINEALNYQSKKDLVNAAKCYEKIIQRGLEDAKLLSDYGILLFQLGYIEKSINLFKNSINNYPNESDLYINLSNVLKLNKDLTNSEILIRKALEINPLSIIALNNLSSILIVKNKFFEAENFSLSSLKIESNNHFAYYNLGLIYSNLGRLNDSIYFFRQAINYENQDFFSNLNLGAILLKKGNFKESKKYSEIALNIKSNSYEALFNLGQIALYTDNFTSAVKFFKNSLQNKINNYKIYRFLGIAQFLTNDKEACESLSKSISLSPKKNISVVIFNAIKSRTSPQINNGINNCFQNSTSTDPIILKRDVEKELLEYIYKRNTLDLNKFDDPTFGKARGTDYKLFEEDIKVLNTVKQSLIELTKNFFKSEVYFKDSFFTILEGKGVVEKHNHLDNLDKVKKLNLFKQKLSLVYYLKTGDTNCSEPGYINFYNPNKKLLPENGMIIIFPSERIHSVIYNGSKDRVILGVNFYIY